MDASDVTRKKMARMLASIQINPSNAVTYGQTPNNPPLTPMNKVFIESQYPATDFANINKLYPCGTTICSTIYPTTTYNFNLSTLVTGSYYNNTR